MLHKRGYSYRMYVVPLLFVGVEDDGLFCVVVVPLELIAEDPLTRIAVKRSAYFLNGICHSHILPT